MKIYTELKENLLSNTSLALGFFDGVHTGHQQVINNAVENARKMNLTSAIVTFSKHPRAIVAGGAPEMLTCIDDRLNFFKELGIDTTILLDFNENLSHMIAKEYIEKVLIACLGAKSISVGYNHKFGSDKKGSGEFLEEYGRKHNIKINVVPPVKIDGSVVSSSVIRAFLTSGDVATASEFLGRPFKLKGKVIKGEQIGRTIGFPTANLSVQEDIITPLNGVYMGKVKVKNSEYDAVINIGRKPTVGEYEKELIEAHLLDFDEDIYGESIEIYFLDRIRDEKKFESLEKLKEQIKKDCNSIIQYR